MTSMTGGTTEKSRECFAMATGLYVTPDQKVVVSFGSRKLPIPISQYKANGYKPSLEKLTVRDAHRLEAIQTLNRYRRSALGRND